MTPKERVKQRLDDMRDVLKTEQGRRVVWEIMEMSGFISRNPALDPALMNRNEGKREIGMDVHDWVMAASPRAFLSMLEQRAQDMEKKHERRDDERDDD